MFNDRTEIRNTKDDKELWKAAAALAKAELAEWIRKALTRSAKQDISQHAQ